MGDEYPIPLNVVYALPFILGPITGVVCAVFMSNIRIWHGLLLGFCLGPVMFVLLAVVALLDWINSGSDEFSAGGYLMFLLVALCSVPAAWGLCFLVSRMRVDANEEGGAGGRSP